MKIISSTVPAETLQEYIKRRCKEETKDLRFRYERDEFSDTYGVVKGHWPFLRWIAVFRHCLIIHPDASENDVALLKMFVSEWEACYDSIVEIVEIEITRYRACKGK